MASKKRCIRKPTKKPENLFLALVAEIGLLRAEQILQQLRQEPQQGTHLVYQGRFRQLDQNDPRRKRMEEFFAKMDR